MGLLHCPSLTPFLLTTCHLARAGLGSASMSSEKLIMAHLPYDNFICFKGECSVPACLSRITSFRHAATRVLPCALQIWGPHTCLRKWSFAQWRVALLFPLASCLSSFKTSSAGTSSASPPYHTHARSASDEVRMQDL